MDQNFSLIEPQAQATEGTAKKNNTKLYAIIGGAVLVVLILIGVLAGGGSVDSVVKKYADACVDFDAAKIVSVMHPKYIEYIEKNMDDDYKNVTEAVQAVFDDAEEDLDIKSYVIDEEVEEYTEEEMTLITATMKTTFDIEAESVKAIKVYTIEFTADYEGEEETEEVELLMVQVDNKWYVFGDNFVISEVD